MSYPERDSMHFIVTQMDAEIIRELRAELAALHDKLTAADCGHPKGCIQTRAEDDSLCCRWCAEARNLQLVIDYERERAEKAESLAGRAESSADEDHRQIATLTQERDVMGLRAKSAEALFNAAGRGEADAKRRLAAVTQKCDTLGQQLEHDRTLVADCLTAANRAIDSRHWLTEGRGPYEWNDDRWHEEFYAAAREIKAALEPMTKVAADWSGCPMSTEAIAKARVDLVKERDTLAAQAVQLREALEGMLTAAEMHGADSEQFYDARNAGLAAPSTDAGSALLTELKDLRQFRESCSTPKGATGAQCCDPVIDGEMAAMLAKLRELREEKEARKGIYVASRASIPARSAMWRSARRSGMKINSSWVDEAGPGETADLRELWTRIDSEIKRSVALILYAENDDFPLKGALVEVGIALGYGVPVYVVAPGVELDPINFRPLGSWVTHPLVELTASIELAYERIGQRAAIDAARRK